MITLTKCTRLFCSKSFALHLDCFISIDLVKATKKCYLIPCAKYRQCQAPIRDGLIVMRNYRMPIYRTFQHIEKVSYRTSNIEYHDIDLFCVFSPKIPKILWKSENSPEIPKISENSPKIPQKEGLF